MLDLSLTSCTTSGEFFEKALDAVEFYGFREMTTALKDTTPQRTFVVRATPALYTPHEKKLAGVIKTLVAHDMHRAHTPRMFYSLENSAKAAALNLHLAGTKAAVAEGMMLATLIALAHDSGIPDVVVHINSVGDKESYQRFTREVTNFLKTRLDTFPAPVRADFQDGHPLRAYMRLLEKGDVLGAPNPMEYLNDESRRHLHDVLEHVEQLGIPYELDPTLVGSHDCWQHTTFELRTKCGDRIARGGRHDALAYKTYRVDLPVVSAVIEHTIHGRAKPKKRAVSEPRIFFAQLGPQAKMKSFAVLEQLRTSGVPIAQLVTVENIGHQLTRAEQLGTPYAVIIGHKEALDGTAIIRDMETRSQTVVPLTELPARIKKLKM